MHLIAFVHTQNYIHFIVPLCAGWVFPRVFFSAFLQIQCRSLCVPRRPTGPRHGKGGPNGRQRAPAFVLIATDARLRGFGLEVLKGHPKKNRRVRVREGSCVLNCLYIFLKNILTFIMM